MEFEELLFIHIAVLTALLAWYLSIRTSKKDIISQLEIVALKIEQNPPSVAIIKFKEQGFELKEKINKGQEFLNKAKSQNTDLKPDVKLIDLGIIPPVFDINDTEQLKQKILESRIEQEKLIHTDEAIEACSKWIVNGCEYEGQKMITACKINILNAFNNEFDMIRKKMRLNTFYIAQKKIYQLESQLVALGETQSIQINSSYIYLKLEELRIWHNEIDLKQTEKIANKARKRLMNIRASKESKKIDELDNQLDKKELKLEELKIKIKNSVAKDVTSINKQIKELDIEMSQLLKQRERKISQAQITRVGYIYVISNIGSFGKGIVKIGMTRRLDPMDRVIELGDASVPFKFDVHTLAYVDDAPNIERALHRKFSANRVNVKNKRKEFFRVSPQAVQQVMEDMNIISNWYFDYDAREYFESELKRNVSKARNVTLINNQISLPTSI